MKAVNDVLQRHIALKALQAAVIQRDDVTTGGTLKGRNRFQGLAGGAVRHQDAVSTVKAQAVGTRQEQGIFKQLKADRAGQLRLQCFHLQLNQSKGDIKSHGSWPITYVEEEERYYQLKRLLIRFTVYFFTGKGKARSFCTLDLAETSPIHTLQQLDSLDATFTSSFHLQTYMKERQQNEQGSNRQRSTESKG